MNWREIDWDIAMLGRVAGIAIITAGVVLAALDASAFDLGRPRGGDSSFRFRYFLADSLQFAWKGGLVFAGARLVDRFGWGGRGRIDWHDTQLLRRLGIAIATIGISVTVWNLVELNAPDASSTSRLFIQGVIAAAWQGGMLVLAAEVAERVGWRGREDGPEEVAAEVPA